MGSVGYAYGNAMCGSVFATLECELLEQRRLTSQAEEYGLLQPRQTKGFAGHRRLG